MSYQVIARKYRPQRFSDVVGQEHVTQTLVNAIRQNRIAHAYLFVGPRGTGKTTMARIFAKCLNCTGGPKADFDDNDPRCREIAEGRSLDVLEIDGASNRGIEEIRELRDTVKYAPATSKYKIYIIDEVHMLTKEAFNALLKTLEEPPEHVKFMFATTEPEKVLPTILSRCQRFDLRRIPTALIVKHLAHISELEGVKIDEAALYAIARGADGGMRDAESTLDQLISFCGDQIVEQDVLSMFGLAARGQILALARSIVDDNAEAALRELNELSKNGKDLGRLLSDLLHHFRNLLLFQVSNGDLGLIEVSEAEAAAISEQSKDLSVDGLTRIMEVLTESEGRLRDAASKKIFFEVALLKAIQAKNAVPIDTVLKKLQSLRTGGGSSGLAATAQPVAPPTAARASAPASTSATPAATSVANIGQPERAKTIETPPPEANALRETAPSPASAPATDTSTPATDNLAELWTRVLDAVGKASMFTRSYLVEAHPVSLTKTAFTIGLDPKSDHIGLVDNKKTQDLIQTKLRELGCGDIQVRFVKAEPPPGWVPPVTRPAAAAPPVETRAPASSAEKPGSLAAPPAPAKVEPKALTEDEFKNDPLIRKALEIFKGTIVEVRV